jgi:hypothetical protein
MGGSPHANKLKRGVYPRRATYSAAQNDTMHLCTQYDNFNPP